MGQGLIPAKVISITNQGGHVNPSAMSVDTVRGVISEYFPHLWPAVEAGLSTCATLLLADNVNPVALIYVGAPSAGKTTVVSMFEGATANGQELCYRSDKFTTASFVSQAAKVAEQDLSKVDLLPRIKHKVLLTPELSTIFRGKQDELAERFSTLTRILDGHGYTTDSGTHGQRGYTGDYLFAWLGATTPFVRFPPLFGRSWLNLEAACSSWSWMPLRNPRLRTWFLQIFSPWCTRRVLAVVAQ